MAASGTTIGSPGVPRSGGPGHATDRARQPVQALPVLGRRRFGGLLSPGRWASPPRSGTATPTPSENRNESGKTGWGIGLAVVQGIVHAHGGMVKVESYPQQSTTFTVDLPVDARRASRIPASASGERAAP